MIKVATQNVLRIMRHVGYSSTAANKMADVTTIQHRLIVVHSNRIAEIYATYGYIIPVNKMMEQQSPALFRLMMFTYKKVTAPRQAGPLYVFPQGVDTNVPVAFEFLALLLNKGLVEAVFDPDIKVYLDCCKGNNTTQGE